MLQQTQVETVKVYYQRFIKTLPKLEDLATVHQDELLKHGKDWGTTVEYVTCKKQHRF